MGYWGGQRRPLGGRSVLSLYNALVLPHLQYCLLVWGDFQEGGNLTLGAGLLRHQKCIARLVAGIRGRCHADPLLAEHGMLKVVFLEWQAARGSGGNAGEDRRCPRTRH